MTEVYTVTLTVSSCHIQQLSPRPFAVSPYPVLAGPRNRGFGALPRRLPLFPALTRSRGFRIHETLWRGSPGPWTWRWAANVRPRAVPFAEPGEDGSLQVLARRCIGDGSRCGVATCG